MVCTAVASSSFAVVTYAWRALDAADRAATEAAVNALEQRLRESRDKLSRLPQLREAARKQPMHERVDNRSAGGDWHAVAKLASRAGVTLRALTPVSSSSAAATRTRSGNAAGRALRIDGRSDFSGLYAFLSGLSTLPMLVVPETIDIKPDKDELAFDATLGLFDMPPVVVESAHEALAASPAPASPAPAPPRAARSIPDPFRDGGTGAHGNASVGRLIGILHDGRRALALFEAASAVQAVTAVPGQMLGPDRLIAIDAAGVTLANREGTRRVLLSEAAR